MFLTTRRGVFLGKLAQGKRVNIELPKDLHMKAKLISVLNHITLNDYLAEAIKKAINKDENQIKELLKKEVEQ
jgi:hypothetical protein